MVDSEQFMSWPGARAVFPATHVLPPFFFPATHVLPPFFLKYKMGTGVYQDGSSPRSCARSHEITCSSLQLRDFAPRAPSS
jgi:hypothetical protein